MNPSATIVVLHPQSRQRILLRSVLEDDGRTVVTDPSWPDLLADRLGMIPAVILLHRSLADMTTLLQEQWPAAELVILPEGLEHAETWRDTVIQLLRNVDQLLSMRPTTNLLPSLERKD